MTEDNRERRRCPGCGAVYILGDGWALVDHALVYDECMRCTYGANSLTIARGICCEYATGAAGNRQDVRDRVVQIVRRSRAARARVARMLVDKGYREAEPTTGRSVETMPSNVPIIIDEEPEPDFGWIGVRLRQGNEWT